MALAGDIEKAFLMVSMHEEDRDSLRFLWVSNPSDESSDMITLRFTRVMFGVSSSPFLLNATINHHIESFHESDPAFVDKFLSSIYVDDLVSGADDVKSIYEFYVKSKVRLASAGFNLRKFVTNSHELRDLIQNDEIAATAAKKEEVLQVKQVAIDESEEPKHTEEDQSYAKSSLGVEVEEKQGIHKILGVQWDVTRDELLFDLSEVVTLLEDSNPTKRSVVAVTAKFFDPLGVISPVTILYKMLCQQLCEMKIGWDEPLSGKLLEKWNSLASMMKLAKIRDVCTTPLPSLCNLLD